MGIYVRVFAYVHVYAYMCGSVYVYACNIWMMLVCRCMYIQVHVFDHACVNVCMCICMCRYVYMSVCFVTMLMFNLFVCLLFISPIIIC